MSYPGLAKSSSRPSCNADFAVDQVTDPNGAPANVLDLDLGFAVNGHIDFPNWLSGTGNVAIYADQRGGGYNQKILSTDITITANPTGSIGYPTIPWTLTYPTDLPSSSTAAFRSFASAGFDGVQPHRCLYLQRCALGHRSVRGNGDLHDQLSSSIFLIASSSRKSLTQVRGPGMAAAANPGPGPRVQMGDGACPGRQPGPPTALRVTI